MPFLILLLILALSACSAQGLLDRVTGPEAKRPLILISLDGFHPDYLDRGLTPTLQRLADEGVRARWMTPSFPSKTFPNHYTLVTGLVPDHHGIVDNTMQDPELGRFSPQIRDAVGDGRWWGGEPIWVGARRQGLRTATVFWPGSEAAIDGIRPNEWRRFDPAMLDDQRVDLALEWLSRSPRMRPHFVTLYFDHLDKIGHSWGPEASQVNDALVAIDATLARLLNGLAAAGLQHEVNLVVVSDHGMAELVPEREIILEDLIDPQWVHVVNLAEIASFEPREGFRSEAEAALLKPHQGMECYRKHETPQDWRYGSHSRIPSIVCQLHEGWRISRRETFNPWRGLISQSRGAHGFDPDAPSMRALFIANGPDFRKGLLVEPLPNTDVYPLLARLLKISPAANDGNPETTIPMLASGSSSGADNQKSVQP